MMNPEPKETSAAGTADASKGAYTDAMSSTDIAEQDQFYNSSIAEIEQDCNDLDDIDPHDLFVNIPNELKAAPNWVYCEGDKIPRTPFDGMAKAGDPSTWSTFDKASECASICYNWQIGYQFDDNGIVGIDLDHVRDPSTGIVEPWADDVVKRLDSYTEISTSGTGLHIIVHGELPPKHRCKITVDTAKNQAIEFYHEKRFFVMTGNVYHDKLIEDRKDELESVYNLFISACVFGTSPNAVPLNMTSPMVTPQNGANGVPIWKHKVDLGLQKNQNFYALWNGQRAHGSESEDDLAMFNHLAYWVDCDAQQMVDAFKSSPFYATKDAAHKQKIARDDYVEATVNKAIQGVQQSTPQPAATSQSQAVNGGANVPGNKFANAFSIIRPELTNSQYSYKRNDIGLGRMFADIIQNEFRYCYERKSWFHYDGRVWVYDKGAAIANECKAFVESLIQYAKSTADDDFKEYVKKLAALKRRESIIKDAQSEKFIRIADFDSTPALLNCLNGTLNLETGVFYKHTATDYISKIANVNYVPYAVCARWEKFVEEIFLGDKDLILFFQQAIGYGLTGDNRRECFFILYGPTTRNGKGTAMETVVELMGSYSRVIMPDTLAAKDRANSSGPSEDIAKLAGCRIVNVSEPDKSLQLNSALIKSMTGNDTITARFLFENSFEFSLVCKFFMNTNFRPQTNDHTLFASDRVWVIPFDRHFEVWERDVGLKAELRRPESLSGILNWALQGLASLNANGFHPSAAVSKATDEYREASDKIARFVAECLEADPNSTTSTTDAYKCYKNWCENDGVRSESMQNFITGLNRMAFTIKRVRPNHPGSAKQVKSIIGYKLL